MIIPKVLRIFLKPFLTDCISNSLQYLNVRLLPVLEVFRHRNYLVQTLYKENWSIGSHSLELFDLSSAVLFQLRYQLMSNIGQIFNKQLSQLADQTGRNL